MKNPKLKYYAKGMILFNPGITGTDKYGNKIINEYEFNRKGLTLKECYINQYFIPKITFANYSDLENNKIKWKVTIELEQFLEKKELDELFHEICTQLTLNLAINMGLPFMNSNLPFFYFIINTLREIDSNNKTLIEPDPIYIGPMEAVYETKLNREKLLEIFNFPHKAQTLNNLAKEVRAAFLRISETQDNVSKFILSYFILEILYRTDEFKKRVKEYKEKNNTDEWRNVRSKLLYDYLTKDLNIYNFISIDNTASIPITEELLKSIILKRNDLYHRVKIKNLDEILYDKLIPLVRTITNQIINT